MIGVAEAAKLVGMTRQGVMRAIKTGRLSASRAERDGRWLVDPAELLRVYDAQPEATTEPTTPAQSVDGATIELQELRARITAAEALLVEVRSERDFLRERLRAEHESLSRLHERLSLPPPAPLPERPRWPNWQWPTIAWLLLLGAGVGLVIWRPWSGV